MQIAGFATIVKLNPAELVLESNRQSLTLPDAKKKIPEAVRIVLSESIESLQKKMDQTSKQIAGWKKEFDEFIEKLSPAYGQMDIQDLVAKFRPEMLVK